MCRDDPRQAAAWGRRVPGRAFGGRGRALAPGPRRAQRAALIRYGSIRQCIAMIPPRRRADLGYPAGSAVRAWRGRWLGHWRIVAGPPTGAPPERRAAGGI